VSSTTFLILAHQGRSDDDRATDFTDTQQQAMTSLLVTLIALIALSLSLKTSVVEAGSINHNTDTDMEITFSAPLPLPVQTPSIDDGEKRLAPFCLRLHLIRHGETIANVHNIVLGQGDSPLTENGVALAVLAAEKISGKRVRYWRTYCSDLQRAHRTAKIVLGLEDGDGGSIENTEIELVVDSRLREIAKGAREGYAKRFSNEEALAMRRSEADTNGSDIDVPMLESVDDAWSRVKGWIDSIIHDASNEYYSTIEEGQVQDQINDSRGIDNVRKIYDVFVLSHSALIRTMIYKMVGHELPSDYATTKEGSILIPNLSRTMIDIRPLISHRFTDNVPGSSWISSLHRLADVSHLTNYGFHEHE
jgi:broad specificity phosphatase PhoE